MPECSLEMTYSRAMASPLDRRRWYHANMPSPVVLERVQHKSCPCRNAVIVQERFFERGVEFVHVVQQEDTQ